MAHNRDAQPVTALGHDVQAETLDLKAVLTAHIENEYNKVWAFDAVGVPAASVLAGDAIRIVREHDRPELERLRAKVEAVEALAHKQVTASGSYDRVNEIREALGLPSGRALASHDGKESNDG